MAKQNTTPEKETTTIVVFKDENKLVNDLKNLILSKTGDASEFLPLADIQKIENKADYDTVSAGVKKIKKYIRTTQQGRLDVTRQVDAFKKLFTDFEKELVEPAEKILHHLEPILVDFEQAEERERQRIYQERIQKLTDAGYVAIGTTMVCGPYHLSGEQIQSLSDEDLQGYIDRGNQHLEQQQILIKQQQEREAEIQRKMDEMQKMMEESNAKLAEANAKLAEVKAQEAALEHRYENPQAPLEPVDTAPALEFDLPPVPPVESAPIEVSAPAEQVFTEPQLDTVAYNKGVSDALHILDGTTNEDGSPMKKKDYQMLIKALLK